MFTFLNGLEGAFCSKAHQKKTPPLSPAILVGVDLLKPRAPSNPGICLPNAWKNNNIPGVSAWVPFCLEVFKYCTS